MRDIVVTEYGVADLRGHTDAEVIKRMIAIADSRFQAALLKSAQNAGKVERDWQVPPAHRRNTPDAVAEWLDPYREGTLPDFPFGTDFDDIEQILLPALSRLGDAANDKRALAGLLWASLALAAHPHEGNAMDRMGFERDAILTEPLQARALRGALRKEAAKKL